MPLYGGGAPSGGSKVAGTKDTNNPIGGNYTVDGITYDPDGVPYERLELRLPKGEYGSVIRAINTRYSMYYEGKTHGQYSSSSFVYWFEIHGFDTYNIYAKYPKE